jgi:two-component system, OmpR family, response regulator
MATDSPRILVVEDDLAVRETVVAALQREGFEVRAEHDGLRLDAVAREFRPDLAVLDVRLPAGPSGLSMARMLRSTSDVPILFLTAADQEEDRIAGFEAGADDYVGKPFSVSELLARVRALLRRSGRLRSETLQVGDLVIDEGSRTATRGGRDLELTRIEFDLLTTLARQPGRVHSKGQLLTTVWGMDVYDPNLVEVHVSSLRRKLEAEEGARLIHTVRGVGYALRP